MFEGLEKRSEKVFSVVGWPFRADGVGWDRLGQSMNPGLQEVSLISSGKFQIFRFVSESSEIDLFTSERCFGVIWCVMRPSAAPRRPESTTETPGRRILKAGFLEI